MHNDDSVSSDLSLPAVVSDPASDDSTQASTPDIVLTSDIPPPKRYAHFGKRRRSFTDELFRCPYTDKISRSDLICNALLWRNRPEALREHLKEHLALDKLSAMSDDEVVNWYIEAKKIFLERIPEDAEYEDELENLSEDEEGELEDYE